MTEKIENLESEFSKFGKSFIENVMSHMDKNIEIDEFGQQIFVQDKNDLQYLLHLKGKKERIDKIKCYKNCYR